MNKCLLCNQREADKTGSHIIPSFLMKRINGDGKRDHEVGFEMRQSCVETYFGRDIYEEKRKSLTDNEEKLFSTENKDVKDYIFCKKCEDYFGSLESKYAPSLNLNFSEGKNTQNKKISPSDALLFWCSIVWRVSRTNHLGNSLNPDLEERLRQALVSNNIDNLNVKYALFRCKDYSKRSGHGTSACMDVNGNTILLFVDEFILVMAFDMEEEIRESELLGMVFTLNKVNLNDGKKNEEISPLPDNIFSQIIQLLIHLIIKNMKLPEIFKEMHKEIFGEDIPENILNGVLNMIQKTGKIADKYTIENYAWCYREVLKKYGLVLEHEDDTFEFVR